VVGTEFVTFSLWSRLMRNIRVRVMRTLPSGILIGRRLMLRLKMSLDFRSGVGSFSADTPRGPRIFSGRILHDCSGALEQVEVIYEADLEDSIRELDLQEFGDEEAQEALRTLLLRYRDFFSAKTSTVPGSEFGLDISEGADLTKLNRPAFPKSRVEKELEAERVRDLFIGVFLCRRSRRMRRTISWWGRNGTPTVVLDGCELRRTSVRSMW
jgi:hypothetical protein